MSRPHLLDALRDQVLLCDGGFGARIQGMTLDVERDFWGKENCTEVLILSRPDIVRDIHQGYFAAGADMVLTNTFGGSPITLGEFELEDKAFEINKLGVELAREAAEMSGPTSSVPVVSTVTCTKMGMSDPVSALAIFAALTAALM